MTALKHPTRAKIGIVSLVLFALFVDARSICSNLKLMREAATVDEPSPAQAVASSTPAAPANPMDRAAYYEARLGPLKSQLPPGTTVGYVTDNGGVFASVTDYYLVRYTLAPVIISGDLTHNRLLLQMWPSVLFIFFMIARTPEEVLVPGTPAVDRRRVGTIA